MKYIISVKTGAKTGIPFYLLVFLFLLVLSCEQDKNNKQYEYYLSSQKLKSISVEQAKSVLGLLKLTNPEAQDIIDKILYNTDVYKIVYKTKFKGSEIKASGIICVPVASGSFPLLSFQNGTNILKSDAPSLSLFNPMYTLLQSMSGNGYIILMPDYLGFGESGQILHPYYHRESSDASVIDLINASDEFLSDNEVSATGNNKLFLMGYSQGGWATLSALESLESDPYETKDIMAASCGAGAYDVVETARYILQLDMYPAPFYLPYFIESHIRNGFLDESLQKYFNEPYASRIPELFDGTKSGGAINAELNDSVSVLVTSGLWQNFDTGSDFLTLREDLGINSVAAWPSGKMLMFFHGEADDNVPSFESHNIYNAFRQQGLTAEQVQLVTVDSLNHDTGLIPWGLSTIKWFNEIKSSVSK